MRQLQSVLLSLALLGCGSSAQPPLQAALPAAIAALPWDSAPAGAARLCGPTTPCDTLLVEPRVVRLPAPAPAFFVPASRDLIFNLSTSPGVDFRALRRVVRFSDWGACLARRLSPDFPRQRVACLALGIAADAPVRRDTLRVAILALTPAQGLVWPRVRVAVAGGQWRGSMTSYAGQ
jgi:hypothetical protein